MIASEFTIGLDTLWIKIHRTYKKRVYRIADGMLLCKNKGSWELKGKRIIFKDFFFDSDQGFAKEFEGYSDILITTSLDVRKSFGKVSLDFLEEKNDYLYRKVKTCRAVFGLPVPDYILNRLFFNFFVLN